LLQQLGIGTPGQKILDLGSGTGALAIPFAKQGAQVIAVDPSEGQIRAAKTAARKHRVKISFRVATAEETRLPNHSFDAITASMCWAYFDIKRMKSEVPRLLRPGGLLLVSTLIWDMSAGGIVPHTNELIQKYNAQARRKEHRRDRAVIPDWSRNWLRLITYHELRADLPFTRESWRGRIRACRWIGAALSRRQTEMFDREHEAMLERMAPPKFAVPHRITIQIFEPARDASLNHPRRS